MKKINLNKIKLKFFTLAIMAIIIALFSQGSLAYYTTIGSATNVVTSGNISFIIHEKDAQGNDFPKDGVKVIPGSVVGKRVTIESACEHPFYLRVKLVSSWNQSTVDVSDCIGLDINSESWILRDDGYYYYVDIVEPGETTPAIFTQVEIIGENIGNEFLGTVLSLTVAAEAVQSENNPAENAWDAIGWPDAP